MRFLLGVAGSLLLLPALSLGQGDLGGRATYPNFRSLSGLPGGGFTLNRRGVPFAPGVLSYSSPIAYGLKPGRILSSVSLMNLENQLPPLGSDITSNGPTAANGTGTIMLSWGDDRWGTLTYTFMVLSARFDNVGNIHYQLPIKDDRYAIAVGVQDISGSGGSAGDSNPGLDDETSRSYFAVMTVPFGDTAVSFGSGNTRFRRGFASVSHQATPRLNIFTEYDSYNINWGVGYDLGRAGFSLARREASAYLSAGSVRGRYPFLSVTFAF